MFSLIFSFHFISCWWRKIDLRTIFLSSGRFRINKRIRYRLYQVISRNAVEQIERTHGFDRKRMKPKQKNWEKEMFIMWSNRVIGLMDHPAPKQKHTNTSSHNYGWKQLLFAWPLCAPARLSTRSFVGSIARTHARHARPTVHRTTQLHSDVHTNINIIIKLDAHHKFQSVCKERLGHLHSHYDLISIFGSRKKGQGTHTCCMLHYWLLRWAYNLQGCKICSSPAIIAFVRSVCVYNTHNFTFWPISFHFLHTIHAKQNSIRGC